MRARLFLYGRFVAYVVIVAVGSHVLLSRDSADSKPLPPTGVWLGASTSQQHPVRVKMHMGRVVDVRFVWSGTCDDGRPLPLQGSGFADSEDDAFHREGSFFRQDTSTTEPWTEGQTSRLGGHLQGEVADGVARGSVQFIRTIDNPAGRPPTTCRSGPVGWAVDLPR